MLVYICCSGGGTSSFFCLKIKQAAEGENILVDDIDSILKNYEELDKEYDLLLAYGPTTFIREEYMIKNNLGERLARIWIAPQMRHMKGEVLKVVEAYGIPVDSIDMLVFGRMNGEKALADIKEKTPF